MNMEEYQKVKNLNYLEYCDYLQGKYGIGRADYMTKSFNKNQKVSRAKEGLYAHHKMENEYPCLSEKIMAKRFPWECQAKENIVYCDELEHLYLHILIAEISSTNSHRRFFDLSDAVQIMISNLFDVYSGYEAKVGWKRSCDDKVREDKDVFFELVKRTVEGNLRRGSFILGDILFFPECDWANSKYWDKTKNAQVYEEVASYLSNTSWNVVNNAVHTLVSKIEDRNSRKYIFGGLSNDTILLKNPQNVNEASLIRNATRRLVDFDCIDEISLLRFAMSTSSELFRLADVYAMAQGKDLPDDIGLIPEGDSLPDVICNGDCNYLIRICASYNEKENPCGRYIQAAYHIHSNSAELSVGGFPGTFSKIVDAVTDKTIASDTVDLIVTRPDFVALQNRYDFKIASVLGGFYLKNQND